MVSISDILIKIRTDITGLKTGLASATNEVQKHESDVEKSADKIANHWMSSIYRIIGVYALLRSAWSIIKSEIQEGLDDMTTAIKAELRPQLESLNESLKDLARSDIPARIAAAFIAAGNVLETFAHQLKMLYYTATLQFEEAGKETHLIDENVDQIKNSLRTLVFGTDQLKTNWEQTTEAVKKTNKELTQTTSLMDQWQAAHAFEPGMRMGIRQSRPEDVGIQAPGGGHVVGGWSNPSLANNPIAISMNVNINSNQDPMKVMSDVGAGISMGIATGNIKPR